MKPVVLVLAFAVGAAVAPAAAADSLAATLASRGALFAAFADSVDVGPIAWTDPGCSARFGRPIAVTGADRKALAACLADLHLVPARLDTGSPEAAIGSAGAVIGLVRRRGRIAALGAAGPDPRDASYPTVLRWWVNREVTPSPRVRLAIARTAKKYADAVFKICHDEVGTVVSRRIVRGSGIAGFDDEALAYFQGLDHVEPYHGAGAPRAACSILALRYPELLAGDRANSP